MSLQGSLRFNPKDYVRTIFFGLHGSDNNDGLNEDALKREFWAAIATANLIPLGAGERVCVVGLGTGSFDHADPSGTGQITINSGVDVFAPHASIVGIEGTDPQPKLILQGSNTFNVSILSARPAVPSANGLLIERGSSGSNTFINIDAFNNISAAAGTGKFNFTGITNAEFFIKIDKINASTQVLSCDAADSFVDLEINQIVAAPLSTTFSFISIEDSEAIIKLDNIRSGGSSGTLTGILASGTAKVCVYAFVFEGLDIEYATEDTATMDIFTCMDNGTSDASGGAINIVSPGSLPFDLAATLVAGNTTGGTNIQVTTADRIEFGTTGTYLEALSGSRINGVATAGFLFTGSSTSAGWGQSAFEVKRNGTNESIILSAINQQISFSPTGYTSQLDASAATVARTWSLPDKTGTIALIIIATSKVANYTAVSGDFVLMTTGAIDRTVSLPSAASNINAIIEVKKIDSGTGNVIIDAGADLIDGANTQTITSQYTSLTLHSDGTQWWIK